MNSLTLAAGIVALAATLLVVLAEPWETDLDYAKRKERVPFLNSAQKKGFSKLLGDLTLLMVVGVGFMIYHHDSIAAGVVGGLAVFFGYCSIILLKGIRDKAE